MNNLYRFLKKLECSQFYMIILYKILESSKCINHRIYNDFLKFEAYLNVLPFSLAKIKRKFRCSDHKSPIERGCLLGIDRCRRLCTLCDSNQLCDKYHYIYFNVFQLCRHVLVPSYILPASRFTYKCMYVSLMNSNYMKIALFLKSITRAV